MEVLLNGKRLGIAALIFGLIGAGLGGYIFVVNTFFAPTAVESPSIQDTWFIYDPGGFYLGNGVYQYFDPMSLVISVNPNESVYILFTGYVRLDSIATNAYIAILIDDLVEMAFLITHDSTGTERFPVAIQYGKSTLSAGTHNVSIWGFSNADFQQCYQGGLLVQTYK